LILTALQHITGHFMPSKRERTHRGSSS